MSIRTKSAIKLGAVVLLTVLVALVAVNGLTIGNVTIEPVASGISLGLDLRGGVYAVYIAQNDQQEDFDTLMNGTIAVLRERLSQQGYNEATVSRQGTNRIRVEIPDVTDPEHILEVIGTPAHLEFVDPEGNVVLEGKDVKRAYPRMEGTTVVVAFELNDSGTQAFADATRNNIGREIAITLDGAVISSPVVNSVITDGQAVIEGMGGVEEASDLAMLIMSGALPLDIRQDEQRTVSATLGVNALNNCLMAGFIGLILVMVFMIAVYRLPGVMASLALTIYVLIVLYALAIVKGVQLTLPGVAGILLGVGMAVDANVIIFERMREELAGGSDLKRAVKRGFKNALSAVIDSNVTTIIAALVLMYFGTGPIRGFAITLFIGVVVSMFTAVVVSRFLLNNVVQLGTANNTSLFTRPIKQKAEKDGRRPFTGHTKVYALISASIIVVALVMSVAGLGINMGIEFTGGSQLSYEVGQEFDVADVERALIELKQKDYEIAKAGDGELKTELQVNLKLGEDNTQVSAALEDMLKEKYPDLTYKSIEYIGAKAGEDLIRNVIYSMLVVFACMLVYIVIRFDLLSGMAAVLALLHDVLIMCAFMVFFRGMFQVNSPFIAAVLTIVGYSINNTIVIFDRIREAVKGNLFADKPRRDIVEYSVSSTLARTLNTTITTLITLVLMFIMAKEIRDVTFPLLVGMLAGAYSSVMLSGQTWAALIDRGTFSKLLKSKKA